MSFGNPLQWHQQLRWRLPVFYMLLALAPFVFGVGIGAVLASHRYRAVYEPGNLEAYLTARSERIAPLLATPQDDTALVSFWLQGLHERVRYIGLGTRYDIAIFSAPSIETAVVDERGAVLAAEHADSVAAAEARATGLSDADTTLVASVLRSESARSVRTDDDTLVSAVPVRNDAGRVVGALYARVHAPYDWRTHLGNVVSFMWGPFSTHALVASIFALGFGLLAARNLTSRLERISKAADAWGRGDLSAVIPDRAEDELGRLATRLNAMASELREVVALRQELATLGERNRLARDLHDTVKQQSFALAMQIGAAQAALGKDPAEVEKRLSDSEMLARSVQQELVGLIKELQPPSARTGKSFAEAVREYTADWSRLSGIAADVTIDHAAPLPPGVEHAFFRVIQEALSNVLRHSRATRVGVRVDSDAPGRVRLSVADDGTGLEPAAAGRGMGLENMRERAEALPGGWFALRATNGHGTCVEAGYDESAPKGQTNDG
jgi:two-component system, NarL family, sensor histidine kinase LiaS